MNVEVRSSKWDGAAEAGSMLKATGTGMQRSRPRRTASLLARWDTKVSPYLFIAPFFALFAVFGAFPMVYTVWVSLHDWNLTGTREFTGTANYEALLGDTEFWNAVFNTFGIFVLATVPQILLALWLAWTLNKRLRARTLLRMGVLLPNVTSVAAVGIIFSMIFARDFGLANWLLHVVGLDAIDWTAHRWSSWIAISIMVDWRWTGYNAVIFLAAMQAIPRELTEAAAIDGASPWAQFWRIVLPLLRPTLMFAVIISTIGGIQLFTEPLLLSPGANAITGGTLRQFQTVAMYLVENAFGNFDFGYAAAIAWMLFLLVLLVSLVNVLLLRRIRTAE